MDLYEGRVTAQPSLRKRIQHDPKESDRALFAKMDLGDVWMDSKIHMAWFYIYRNKYLRIPDSWLDAITEFDLELTQRVL